jgi:hypothetical protein
MKLIELKNIYESMETKIEDIQWHINGYRFDGEFVDSRGDTYEIRLVNLSSYTSNYPHLYGTLRHALIYDIQFGILKNGKSDIALTDKGNVMEILSIVRHAAFDKFKADHIVPDVISFTASSIPTDNTPEQFNKRKQAYHIIANRLRKELTEPYNYPYVIPNIVGKYGTAVWLSKIYLDATEVQRISNVLQRKP